MPEVKYVLPGPESITISAGAADKLIRAGDGDAALLYIYIMKTRGVMSVADAAAALGRREAEIAAAMDTLSRLGLVRADEREKAPVVKEELPEYTAADIKQELEKGSAFKSLVGEVQKSLGKVLSSDDLIRLFGIYDSLGLPPEVVLQLVTHCIDENRRRYGQGKVPTMRYIEKAAYTWEREGIFSLERAEQYLKTLSDRRAATAEVKKVLQIRDRALVATERRYVEEWLSLGFAAEAIEIAYERTLLKTGKLSWGYMNSIIKSWHEQGLHAVDEILARDGKSAPRPTGTKKSTPDPREYEQMKRYLKKLQED